MNAKSKSGRTRLDHAVFVAMPSYDGWYSGGTVSGVYERATQQYALHPVRYSSSLLPKCFNVLWARAVQSNCRWWAMIHADINPPPLWLDTMLADMRRLCGTFLSAVVAIKNDSGDTSTAMVLPGELEPCYRIRESDLPKLPSIFTGHDVSNALGVQGDLLANTGLWVADLAAPWVKQVWFTIGSGIAWDGDSVHVHESPEDWNFSRQLHELGVTVYVTQKPTVGHLGQKEWVCGDTGLDRQVTTSSE